jgi:hypothetical protein
VLAGTLRAARFGGRSAASLGYSVSTIAITAADIALYHRYDGDLDGLSRSADRGADVSEAVWRAIDGLRQPPLLGLDRRASACRRALWPFMRQQRMTQLRASWTARRCMSTWVAIGLIVTGQPMSRPHECKRSSVAKMQSNRPLQRTRSGGLRPPARSDELRR